MRADAWGCLEHKQACGGHFLDLSEEASWSLGGMGG